MIAPLRRRHRLIWLLLSWLVPLLYLLALLARPAPPVNDRLPGSIASDAGGEGGR